MKLVNKGVGAFLVVGDEVDVHTMAALQALMTASVVGFEDAEQEAGQATYVDIVGHKPRGGVH